MQGSNLSFGLALGPPSGALAGRTNATGTIRGTTLPPPPPPGSVLVEYVPGNGWEGAYQGTFRITNLSSATLTGWELDFDFTGTSITFFNGTLSKNGTRHTLTPTSWQATIGPGVSFDNLGFQGSPNLPSSIPSNSILTVSTPDVYAAWNAAINWLGKDSASGGDPDADGFMNFMEYALAGDPLVAESAIQPAVGKTNGILTLRFQRVADPLLLYQVIADSDPGSNPASWETIWSSTGAANTAGSVIVSDNPPNPSPTRRFLRLRVSRSGGS